MEVLPQPTVDVEGLCLRWQLAIHRLIELERRKKLLWLIDDLDLRVQRVLLSEEGGDEVAVDGWIDGFLQEIVES